MDPLRRRLFGRRVLLRPPGAKSDGDLLARCIKCARCVEVCPYRSIRLARFAEGQHYGTPVIDPEKKPCYLCMKCPDVCPTGALTAVSRAKVRMGTARVRKKTCLSWTGTVCNLCYESCPFKEKAITLDRALRPVVNAAACVGCGLCSYVCPNRATSIPVVPRGGG